MLYISDTNSIRTLRRENRTRSGMGYAPGGSLSSRYIYSLCDPLLIVQPSKRISESEGKPRILRDLPHASTSNRNHSPAHTPVFRFNRCCHHIQRHSCHTSSHGNGSYYESCPVLSASPRHPGRCGQTSTARRRRKGARLRI